MGGPMPANKSQLARPKTSPPPLLASRGSENGLKTGYHRRSPPVPELAALRLMGALRRLIGGSLYIGRCGDYPTRWTKGGQVRGVVRGGLR